MTPRRTGHAEPLRPAATAAVAVPRRAGEQARPPRAERATRAVVRVLGRLPEAVQRLIAGRPVVIDGQRLFTEVQMVLRLLNAVPDSDFSRLPLGRARARIDAEARLFGGDWPLGFVEDITLPTRGGTVPARVYRSDPTRPSRGTVVYFHGGGWVVGSIDSADSACRFIAARSDVTVISVGYRLAPEHPFPAGVEDAVDAYRWVRSHPEWGTWVAVAGDSAGGNLSAAVCAATLSDEAGPPDFQLLFFPVTDLSAKHRSYRLFSEGFFLTERQMDWYRGHYLRDEADARDPLASPLLGELTGHPPAHVAVSGFDVLRDEGLAYAGKLAAAGVPVTTQLVEGHIHAFVNASGVGRESSRAFAASVRALADALPPPR
ncbi:alpha/beta hydrolase [Leucobacter massiliensis]|uniref:Alpha/beta hydrolase n=1 Tax=Leucobacter massiliensis TaxID=1686285 RepID=A0A2S9QST6_9MICO|nr:alpha/beta hydrolase [Leucobacter massiliensis]PRI12632.1 alpha/beta hydrolase [Leucobacter massiliensis]